MSAICNDRMNAIKTILDSVVEGRITVRPQDDAMLEHIYSFDTIVHVLRTLSYEGLGLRVPDRYERK